jgi:hypothetical protein
LIAPPVEDSRDQDVLVVAVVHDIALDDERAQAESTLGSGAADARLFDEIKPKRSAMTSINPSAVAGLPSSAT